MFVLGFEFIYGHIRASEASAVQEDLVTHRSLRSGFF
jgi:hypothetical protein